MLWTASRLGDFELEATDGPIGAVQDCLIDRQNWHLRWFVVDTGTWLPGRKVLIAPERVTAEAGDRPALRLAISRAEVEASPPLDNEAPVSRKYEELLVEHYGWQSYWTGLGAAAPADEPAEGKGIPGCARPTTCSAITSMPATGGSGTSTRS